MSGDDDAVHRRFDGDSVTSAVIEAVAEASETDPRTFDQLYETVDPDALSAILERGSSQPVVSFSFEGCVVRVSGDGVVSASPN